MRGLTMWIIPHGNPNIKSTPYGKYGHMRYAIVDDRADHGALLAAAVERYCSRHDIDGIGERFKATEDFRSSYAPGKFDVIFLDCYFDERSYGRQATVDNADGIPVENGLDVARWLRSRGCANPIIFTTISTDFAVDGYQVDAAAYLVKPFGQHDVDAALDKLIDARTHGDVGRHIMRQAVELPIGARTAAALRDGLHRSPQRSDTGVPRETVPFYIIVDEADRTPDPHREMHEVHEAYGKQPAIGPILRIDAGRLAYCRADRHSVMFYDMHHPAEPALTIRCAFGTLEGALSVLPQFFVCARGYIVNLDLVSGIDGDVFLINAPGEADEESGIVRVPISRRRSSEARIRYADRMFSSMRRR